jgi:hypothetical protein
MRIANNAVETGHWRMAVGPSLIFAFLMLPTGAAHAQSTTDPGAACVNASGYAGCSGAHGPVPDIVNDLWNAIAYSPLHNIAAFAGSFTAPENAKAAALKACAARAPDCRLIGAAHDICLAIAFELSAGGRYRIASGVTKQDAEGKALPVCMAEGPKHCTVLAGCSRQPPLLIVTK